MTPAPDLDRQSTLGAAAVVALFFIAVTAPHWLPAGGLLDAVAYWVYASAIAIALLLVLLVPISWYVERQVEEYDSQEVDAR